MNFVIAQLYMEMASQKREKQLNAILNMQRGGSRTTSKHLNSTPDERGA